MTDNLNKNKSVIVINPLLQVGYSLRNDKLYFSITKNDYSVHHFSVWYTHKTITDKKAMECLYKSLLRFDVSISLSARDKLLSLLQYDITRWINNDNNLFSGKYKSNDKWIIYTGLIDTTNNCILFCYNGLRKSYYLTRNVIQLVNNDCKRLSDFSFPRY